MRFWSRLGRVFTIYLLWASTCVHPRVRKVACQPCVLARLVRDFNFSTRLARKRCAVTTVLSRLWNIRTNVLISWITNKKERRNLWVGLWLGKMCCNKFDVFCLLSSKPMLRRLKIRNILSRKKYRDYLELEAWICDHCVSLSQPTTRNYQNLFHGI